MIQNSESATTLYNLKPAHHPEVMDNDPGPERLRLLLENSQDLLVEITPEGMITYVSPNVTRLLGFQPDEVLGTSVFERIHPDDLPQALAQLELPECWAICRYQARDGGWRCVETTGRDFKLPDGTVRGALIVRDITERNRAEQALRESEEKFSKAFRCSPGAMGISDVKSRRFIEVNDGYLNIFGYSREEFLSKSSIELDLWESEEERRQIFNVISKQGYVRNMEVFGRAKNGGQIICLLSAEFIELSGRSCMVSTLTDITSQRRSEKERASLEAQLRQAQKMEAIGTLAGGIAHDFNNILAAIVAYTELAKMESELPEKVGQHLSQVRLACDRAKDLVRQILTFSRQQKQERKPFQLQPVIKEVLQLMRSTLPSTIEIDACLDSGAPAAMADPTQIHQVVVNLCTNAAHAMRGSQGRLTVALKECQVDAELAQGIPDLQPGQYLQLSVSDTGHGMDKEVLKRIFEPFFTTKLPGEGTGLGLPVVHGIVRDHAGAITVQSQPGRGTTFDIYLPALRPEQGKMQVQKHPQPVGKAERILFVDNEPAICTSMSAILHRMGYRVVTHTHPVEALNHFRRMPDEFDLVISDLTMPHMTGVDLAHDVLQLRPRLPVLLASGFSGNLTQEQVRAQGIYSLLPKPISMSMLAEEVRAALDGQPSKLKRNE